ncbi:DUF3892 domain-containing protein [Actinoplanes sp. NPDC026623]|uniref:DUF3892 domain-containing protein n=1 Tax=Actinoplanes sp. NPDC026623 TaxID=3155610 RepID=UPI0033E90F0B
MSDGLLAFLSWARAGLSAGAAGPDPLSGPLPAGTPLDVAYRVNTRGAQNLRARLYGPGDVTAIDARQIIRTDPRPEDDTFPPSLFPLVEFDRPELPWLLTPAGPADRDRVRPWLVLVVVEQDQAQLLPGGALPALKTRLEQLPDLAESHLWAHAQVALDGPLDDARLDRLLDRAPDRTLSRLICPRRLQPRRAYLACVVPAFEPGRRTGLALDLTAADRTSLQPAWTAGTGDAPLLPVYHHWSFATGDAGSFEALVDRLTGRPLPRSVGVRDFDVSRPGGGMPEVPDGGPGGSVELEGALRSLATFAAPWDPDARAAFEAALRPRIEPAGTGDDVTPPVYGLAHAGRHGFTGDGDQVTWLRQLNLDPRYRAIAALGTRAVQDNQEDLIAAAWEQVAALRELNQALRQGQLARTVDQAIYDRRVDLARPGAPLPDDRLLQVAFPVRELLGTTEALRSARAVRATTTPAFRKATRPGRSLARFGGDVIARPMPELAARTLTVNPPLPVPPGMASVELLSAGESMPALTSSRVRVPSWIGPPQGPVEQPVPLDPVISRAGATMPGRVFTTTTDGRLLSRVAQGANAGWIDHGAPPGAAVASAPAAIRDLRVYVTGGDRHIWRLRWDGDAWGWARLPLPGTETVGTSSAPTTTWADARPSGGGLAQTGTYDMVWVVSATGSLYQLDTGDRWIPHGNPGVPLNGHAGNAGPFTILVPGSGRLFQRAINEETGAWQWSEILGSPAAAALGPGRPWAFADRRLAVGSNANELWINQQPVPIFPYQWTLARTDLGAIIGVLPGGSPLISLATGAIMSGSSLLNGMFWQTFLPPPPGFSGATVTGWVRADGVVVTVIAGRYLEGSAGQWTDYGPAVLPGVGSPYAGPPQHRRWRPAIGLMSNIVVSHLDAGAGGDRLYARVGSDAGFDAEARAGWTAPVAAPGTAGGLTEGLGVALADVLGRGGDAPRRDLVALWVERAGNGQYPTYRIGFDLGPGGTAGSWSAAKRCPTPVSTTITSGGAISLLTLIQDSDVDVADLDGDGRPELVMAYATAEANSRAYYRVGWSLDTAGDVTRGWGESQPLPSPGGTLVGIAVAVADLTGDLRPDLVVLYVLRVGSSLQASYRIGPGLNARGRVTGQWTAPIAVGGGPLPAAIQGVSLSVADFSGSERPELMVLMLDNAAGENTARYRIGRDVRATTGVAATWSADQVVPGWFGAEDRGAGVAVGDLDPALLARKKAFAQSFTDAARTHQDMLAVAQRLADADDAVVPLGVVATSARAALHPADRVERRVAARLRGYDPTRVAAHDPLGQVLAAPSFDVPAYELVRDIARDHLLPGADQVPPDTVSLLRATPAFIESFLVGLNHELAREMLWRGLPADRTHTFFRRFWNRTDGTDDIPPIDEWRADAALGDNAGGVGGPDMAILVVRGELLRRHPNTSVYAIQARYRPDGRRELTAATMQPDFGGTIEPDISFFGFPLTVSRMRGSATDPGWFVAFAEHPSEPRFGLDEPGPQPAYGTAPAAWNHLDWAAVVPDGAALAALTHAPANPPFPRTTTLPVRDDVPGAEAFRWAENAAHTAHITLQRPVLLAVHASDLMPHTSGDWQVTHVTRVNREVGAVLGRHPDGRWWRLELAEAIAAIRLHERLYVQLPGGRREDIVVVRSRRGQEYLRTMPGGGTADNLLSLPEPPADAHA